MTRGAVGFEDNHARGGLEIGPNESLGVCGVPGPTDDAQFPKIITASFDFGHHQGGLTIRNDDDGPAAALRGDYELIENRKDAGRPSQHQSVASFNNWAGASTQGFESAIHGGGHKGNNCGRDRDGGNPLQGPDQANGRRAGWDLVAQKNRVDSLPQTTGQYRGGAAVAKGANNPAQQGNYD